MRLHYSHRMILLKRRKQITFRPVPTFYLKWDGFLDVLVLNTICILKKKGTDISSDLDGISTIEFQEKIEEQSLAIRKELRQVGLI